MKIRHILSAAAALAVAATCAVTASAEGYVAALTFQTSDYAYRNTYAAHTILKWDNDLGEPAEVEGATFADAAITADGTYTVSFSGVEANAWNMIKVETNIPAGDDADNPTVKINVTDVQFDGVSVPFDATVGVPSGYAAANDQYDDETHDTIPNAARAQIINTYDGVSATDNIAASAVTVTFDVVGLGGNDTAVADDTVAAPATDEKGSPDTGVEGVAVIAGLAVVAGGAMLLSKKRK